MKRAFDIVFSILGLTVLWPFLSLVGLVVLLTSGPPVFFSQERIGLLGQPFRLFKFRTMKHLKGAEAGLFEPGSRSRVTPFGRFLRAWKIDELPQLWNVLRGEMSLVGPRPEIRHWVEAYPGRWRKVLTVKPGITDPASVRYRDEEEILAASPDPEGTYLDIILPHKLDFYEKYVDNKGLARDCGIVLSTLTRILFKGQGS
jgi:lipopolysaccharide/colanic/teichoic acid biosynthesis glycosyltransferase